MKAYPLAAILVGGILHVYALQFRRQHEGHNVIQEHNVREHTNDYNAEEKTLIGKTKSIDNGCSGTNAASDPGCSEGKKNLKNGPSKVVSNNKVKSIDMSINTQLESKMIIKTKDDDGEGGDEEPPDDGAEASPPDGADEEQDADEHDAGPDAGEHAEEPEEEAGFDEPDAGSEEHHDEEHNDEEHHDEEHNDEEHHDEEHHDEEHHEKEYIDEEHHDKEHNDEEHHDKEHYDEEDSYEEHHDEEDHAEGETRMQAAMPGDDADAGDATTGRAGDPNSDPIDLSDVKTGPLSIIYDLLHFNLLSSRVVYANWIGGRGWFGKLTMYCLLGFILGVVVQGSYRVHDRLRSPGAEGGSEITLCCALACATMQPVCAFWCCMNKTVYGEELRWNDPARQGFCARMQLIFCYYVCLLAGMFVVHEALEAKDS